MPISLRLEHCSNFSSLLFLWFLIFNFPYFIIFPECIYSWTICYSCILRDFWILYHPPRCSFLPQLVVWYLLHAIWAELLYHFNLWPEQDQDDLRWAVLPVHKSPEGPLRNGRCGFRWMVGFLQNVLHLSLLLHFGILCGSP